MAIPVSQVGLPQPKPSEQQIRDRLTLARENWLEWLDPRTNSALSRMEIWRELDRWLDMYRDHLNAVARRQENP